MEVAVFLQRTAAAAAATHGRRKQVHSLFKSDLSRTRRLCEEIIRKDPERLAEVATLLGVGVIEAPSAEEIALANIHERLHGLPYWELHQDQSLGDKIDTALNDILDLLPDRFETYFVCDRHYNGGWSRVSRDFLTTGLAVRYGRVECRGRFIQSTPRNVILMRMWVKEAEDPSSEYDWRRFPLEPEEKEAIKELKKVLY